MEIRPSPIHGNGVFAAVPIRAGTPILEYVGRKISKEESKRLCKLNNPFIFYLNERFDLDGSLEDNLARLLNHSCAPNCESEQVRGGIWITAKRDLLPGEELTFNYGYDLQRYHEYPCHCGADTCVGFMVAEEDQAQVRAEMTQTNWI